MKLVQEWDTDIATHPLTNMSKHWTVLKNMKDKQKKMVRWWWSFKRPEMSLPAHIVLTRLGRRMDDDNLPASLKYIRDTLADCFIPGLAPGRADSDHRLTWEYKQIAQNKKGLIIQFYEVKDGEKN